MNHTELSEAVATKSGLPRKDAAVAVTALVSVLTETLKRGEKITLSNFGIFAAVKKAARKGRNPATGAEIDIAASTKAGFKPGKALVDALKA